MVWGTVFITIKLFYNKNTQNSLFCPWPLYHKKEIMKLEKVHNDGGYRGTFGKIKAEEGNRVELTHSYKG